MTDANEKRRRKALCVIAALFLCFVALARFLDIRQAAASANALYSETYSETLGVAQSASAAAALSLGAAGVVFAAAYGKRAAPYLFGAFVVIALAADRAFFIIRGRSESETFFSSGSAREVYLRLLFDFLATAIPVVLLSVFARRLTAPKDGGEIREYRGAAFFAVLLTALQTFIQVYETVRFFAAYDDVTLYEKTQIALDYLFIFLRYGVVTFGLVLLFHRIADRLSAPRE